MIKLRILVSFFLFCILKKCEILDAAATKRENCKECQTPECKDAASTIKQSIDPKVAPCDDFYRFACGNFIKTAEIPKGVTSTDRYSSLDRKISEQLKNDIEESIQPNEPRLITLTKNYYKACMNTTAIEKNGIQTFLAKLKKAGSWPLLEGDFWNEEKFDWKQGTYAMKELGFNTFYFFTTNVIDSDMLNSSTYSINIDPPFTPFDKDSLEKGFSDKIITAYYNYMVEKAVIYGVYRDKAEKELKEVLEFIIQLGNISLSLEDRIKDTAPRKLMTVKELTKELPSIHWKEYFNTMLKSSSVIIGDDEVIQVNMPDFFIKFEGLMKKTPKRVLANYIFWQVVEESTSYVTTETIKSRQEYEKVRYGPSAGEEQERWKDCLELTSSYLGLGMGALYLRKNFDQKSRKNVEELTGDIREQMRKILEEINWMDKTTKESALEKLESMKISIGSFDEYLDEKAIEEYFKTLEINPNDFLQAYLNLTKFSTDRFLGQFRKSVRYSGWKWLIPSKTTDTSAYLDDDTNTIDIPAGILQDIFFNKDRPQYFNYAGIGAFVIGNKFITAFDRNGRKHDKNGGSKDWWSTETTTKFNREAACIIQQYENYTVKDDGVKLNDSQTEDKNIADNGGVKMSYFAYQEWMKRHGSELTLPNLNYSQSQLFWIQTAITQCIRYSPEYLKNTDSNKMYQLINEFNSPSEFRVTGLFANMPEFAKDFSCPVGSRMNPVKKCSIW